MVEKAEEARAAILWLRDRVHGNPNAKVLKDGKLSDAPAPPPFPFFVQSGTHLTGDPRHAINACVQPLVKLVGALTDNQKFLADVRKYDAG